MYLIKKCIRLEDTKRKALELNTKTKQKENQTKGLKYKQDKFAIL